jgi:hypothetical protein
MAKHRRLPPGETIYLAEPPPDADRYIPSRASAEHRLPPGEAVYLAGPLGRADLFVVLRCGAGRHRDLTDQRPPRVGEVTVGAGVVWWAPSRDAGRRRRGRAKFLHGGEVPPSLRFPCPDRGCSADWNVATDRLEVASWRAAAEGKRELTLGVDL